MSSSPRDTPSRTTPGQNTLRLQNATNQLFADAETGPVTVGDASPGRSFQNRLSRQLNSLVTLASQRANQDDIQRDMRAAFPTLNTNTTANTANTNRGSSAATSGRPRSSRRIRRNPVDRRRATDIRVKLTVLDKPTYTSSSVIDLVDLRRKGLGRTREPTVRINSEATVRQVKDIIVGLFPILGNYDFEILVGRRGCKLELIQDPSGEQINTIRASRSPVPLWVRPKVEIRHVMMTDTPTVTATVRSATPSATPTVGQTVPPPIGTPAQPTVGPTVLQTDDLPALPTEVRLTLPTDDPTTLPTEDPPARSTDGPTAVPTADPPARSTDGPTTLAPEDPPALPTALPIEGFSAPQTESPPSTPPRSRPVTPDSSPMSLPSPVSSPLASPGHQSDLDESFQLQMDVTSTDLSDGLEALRTSGEEQLITVQRSKLVDQAVSAYETIDVTRPVTVAFEEEVGIDEGGLTKDFFAGFWEGLMLLFFRGNDISIPWAPVHLRGKARRVFGPVGRMLEHFVRLFGQMPPRWSRSCLMAMAHPNRCLNEDLLIADVLAFLPEPESLLLERCLGSQQ